MPDYLDLSEAWGMIPRLDSDNPDEASSVIDACKTVKDKIDPAHEQDLMESILNTKIQGTAAIVLKLNGVSTFEELIVQLRKLYPRDIQLRDLSYKNCRHEFNGFQYDQPSYFASFEYIRNGLRNNYLFVWPERDLNEYWD